MSSEGSTGELVVLAGGRTGAPTVGYDAEPIAPAPAPESQLPRKIGRYAVLDIVGIGGMGVVCTAYDPKLDRKVALKLLRERGSQDARRAATARARLQREARALAKLKHPNVVAVHDVDVFDGRLYIAMEFVEGETLGQWFERQQRTPAEIVTVFVQAARGLAAAHAGGITHRDFKPANVRIEPSGRVVVLDFGLALSHGDANSIERSIDDPSDDGDGPQTELEHGRLTAVGRRVGTPAYMAPEQILNQGVGPAADQFAFGVSLYEALYGVLPFRGDAKAAMYAVLDGAISPPPREREAPAWLHRIVMRTLQRDMRARFADMHELIDALERRVTRRRRRLALAAGATLLGAGALGSALWLGSDDPCPGAHDRVAALWGPARAQGLRQAFAATSSPFAEAASARTVALIDERAARWEQRHEAVCEATRVRGEQSDALLDHRMACLDDRLLELASLLEVFDEADVKVVEQSIDASLRLAPVDDCATARPTEGEGDVAADERAAVSRLRESLARADAQLHAYRNAQALALAQAAWHEAEPLSHARTRVHARMTLAHALRRSGEFSGAHDAYVASIHDAAQGHLFEQEADAWTMLVQLEGLDQRKPELGLQQRIAAEAALVRAGSLPRQQAGLAHALGVVMREAGQLDGALEQLRLAVAVRLSIDPDEPQLAGTRNDLGITLIRMGRWQDAEEQLRLALDDARRVRGPEHPLVATTSLNLGNAVLEGRRAADEAAELYARALAIREAVYGPTHVSVAEVLVAQGVLQRRNGDHERSRLAFEQAVALLGGPQGKDPRVAAALNNLGMTAMAAGDERAAHLAFGQALGVFERAGTTRAVSRLRSLLHRCRAGVHLGRLVEAAADCEAALGLADLADPKGHDLADLELARSELALAQGQRETAIAHARAALARALEHERPLAEQREA
ncbi:MAG: serine/threonine-protein kinase, partial [Nannocystaceae bacterium]|nr:serine/threonine-protein kinase [Nannocystaceae bacterium]